MAATDVLATGASVGPSATPQISALLGVTYACHLDQPDSDLWFSSSHASTLQKDTSACNGDSLSDRYAECLWLGEHHTGLGHFLECIDRLHLSHELDDIVLGLCQLIKSRSAIARRHRAVADNLLKASESTCHDSNLEALSNYEIDLGRRAIERAVPRSKPREAVDAELGSLRERWTSSMESREIQLQILVTLSLLQIVSQEPKALETARSRMSLPSATSNAPAADIDAAKSGMEPPRKRSRKLEKAKRWRGTRPQGDVEDAFAWNSQLRRRHTSEWSHDEADRAEADVLEMQGGEVLAMDHLSKRLEALVDILCLRQVASGIDTELESLLNESSDAVKTEHTGGGGGRGVLLGSSVRKLVEEDELDDAQWLCSCVVEPHFEASLPRQCSLFRSKCFVSLQSRTPARPTKVARTGSLGSPTMRSTGSLAPSRSPPNGGLSRVLEKELAGRKARRNPMTKRSMVLGQGREVDMGRRLARSVSVTLDREKSTRSGSVFSRSSNASTLDESSGASLKERSASVYASGALGGKAGMALSQSFAASSQSSGRRLLVLSTPQKEPASRVMGPTHHHFSQMDKPKLVFPSLVLESPTHDGLSVPRGATGRFAERSLSFNALGDLRVPRSPSPDER